MTRHDPEELARKQDELKAFSAKNSVPREETYPDQCFEEDDEEDEDEAYYNRMALEERDRRAEEFEAAQPAWTPGMQGLQPGMIVWALIRDQANETFCIQQGTALVDDVHSYDCEVFSCQLEFDGSRSYQEVMRSHFICWAEAEEKPLVSPAMIRAVVDWMRGTNDNAVGHMVEDWVMRRVIQAAAEDHPATIPLAQAAVGMAAVKFTRWYS